MSTLFMATQASDIAVQPLLDTVASHGYAVVRGIVPPAMAKACLQQFYTAFDASCDHPAIGERPSDVQRNFQKLIVGGGAQTSYYVPRFVRVLYNPLWEPDIYHAHEIFRRMGRVRNHLQGYAPDFAIDAPEGGFWTAARLQHYPQGGGFFMQHRDAVLSTTTEEAGILQFIQILLLLTTRGEEFEQGGAYVEHNNQRIDLEAEHGAGDIVIYDGRSMHGVADIDPHKLPDTQGSTGRVVALASLYKHMQDAEYGEYRSRSFNDESPHP